MRCDAKIATIVFAAIPVAILGGAVTVAAMIAHGASMVWRVPFKLVCHGMVSRCLTIWNAPMPICARCTGIYIGLLVGILTFSLFWKRIDAGLARWMVMIAVIPIGVDGITQALGLRESTNPLRLATGFAVAFFFGIWVLATIQKGNSEEVVQLH
jgi:uncharacterized membrane protein